jgi:tetratricopeptide (TPR) repeat protein
MVVPTFRNSRFHRPAGQPEPDAGAIDRLVRQAAMLARRGDAAGAMRAYQLALLTDESRADLWLDYGMLQHRIGQLADALESFEFALRQDPGLYAAHYRLARVCCDMGHPLRALSHFRVVTQQRPDYMPAWRYVVQITWAVGNLAQAESLAREALGHEHDAEIEAMLGRIAQERAEAGG